MDLYSQTSYQISKLITNRYSTSFSLGIIVFSRPYKDAIYSIYGFVRLADEIVDTFHEHDKRMLFETFRRDTYDAINTGISTNPVLHAFQRTVNKYNIDREYIDAFLHSMELDITNAYYQRALYNTYVFGSAEVVGLMCLRIFCEHRDSLYRELIEPARALGSAFQKVNFLRDIRSDLHDRGRIYLPGVSDATAISDTQKRQLEQEIEDEFRLGLDGIRKLPSGVKLGVYSAYLYYYVLFKKIKKRPMNELLRRRVRISDVTKLVLLFRSFLTVRFLR
jgi:15-cis-phytoene synthase